MFIEAFLRDFREEFGTNPEEAKFPKDRKLKDLNIDSYSSESIGMTLNLAVKHLNPEECYVEVGCWRGFTLCAAALGNEEEKLIGIDNFCETHLGEAEKVCRENVSRFPNVQLIVDDCWKVLTGPLPPIGAYFYDGAHDMASQLRAFEAIHDKLADHAIVIIDDTRILNEKNVRYPIYHWISSHSEYKIEHDLGKEYGERRDGWWCGLMILSFRRKS